MSDQLNFTKETNAYVMDILAGVSLPFGMRDVVANAFITGAEIGYFRGKESLTKDQNTCFSERCEIEHQKLVEDNKKLQYDLTRAVDNCESNARYYEDVRSELKAAVHKYEVDMARMEGLAKYYINRSDLFSAQLAALANTVDESLLLDEDLAQDWDKLREAVVKARSFFGKDKE